MPEEMFSRSELEAAIAKERQEAADEARREALREARQQADDDARQQARQAYGVTAAAAGGTPAAPARPNSYDEDEAFIHGRLAAGAGLGDAEGRMRLNRWQSKRLADGIQFSIQGGSYRSWNPRSADDREVQDDRLPSRGGRKIIHNRAR